MFLNLIIIKIDAKLVGDILNSENTPIVNTHLDSVLISDYLSLILFFEVAYLYHMHCKTNFYVDILATVKKQLIGIFFIVFISHFFCCKSNLNGCWWGVTYLFYVIFTLSWRSGPCIPWRTWATMLKVNFFKGCVGHAKSPAKTPCKSCVLKKGDRPSTGTSWFKNGSYVLELLFRLLVNLLGFEAQYGRLFFLLGLWT